MDALLVSRVVTMSEPLTAESPVGASSIWLCTLPTRTESASATIAETTADRIRIWIIGALRGGARCVTDATDMIVRSLRVPGWGDPGADASCTRPDTAL